MRKLENVLGERDHAPQKVRVARQPGPFDASRFGDYNWNQEPRDGTVPGCVVGAYVRRYLSTHSLAMSLQNKLDELVVGCQVLRKAVVKVWGALDVAQQLVAVQKHVALFGKDCVVAESNNYVWVGSKQLCEASAQILVGFGGLLLHTLVFALRHLVQPQRCEDFQKSVGSQSVG